MPWPSTSGGGPLRRRRLGPRGPTVRHRVLRRLADRVLAVGRQPVHLHHHHEPSSPYRGSYQQSALLVGIVLALVMRGIFIAVGAAAINKFSWVFYLFGAFLVYTAVKLAKEGARGRGRVRGEPAGPLGRAAASRRPRSTTAPSCSTKENGKRLITPMFIVIVTLGTTDLLFALDSIPAIYGLTKEPYLVLTANIFALMGLRQLYFLIGGLLERLIYLSYGLAVAARLHRREAGAARDARERAAVHQRRRATSGGRRTSRSGSRCVVIVGTLAVTTVASLIKSRSMSDADRDTAYRPRRDWEND